MELNKIICGDALEELRKMPSESIDMCITSPPYFGLRDYSVEGQLGLELTLNEYLDKILLITAELKRVLKKTGTMWWNHGDSYGGSGNGSWNAPIEIRGKQYRKNISIDQEYLGPPRKDKALIPKCATMQNYRLAIRMCDEQGWILRNQIIWHKPNCMPSSVKDRFTVDYEPVFFWTKSKKYFFKPQYEAFESNDHDIRRMKGGRVEYSGKWGANTGENNKIPYKQNNPHLQRLRSAIQTTQRAFVAGRSTGRNKRSVWKIATKPFAEAHFATFPETLIETPIKAGCPEMICKKCGVAREKIFKSMFKQHSIGATSGAYLKERNFKGDNTVRNSQEFTGEYTDCGCNAGWDSGIVLDPFMGAGTTALVAKKFGRNYLGVELNKSYIDIANRRLAQGVLKIAEARIEKECPLTLF